MVRVDLSRWSLTPPLLTLLCLEAVHARTRERLLALRDIVQGSCAARVSDRLERHISTVLKWVHDFNERGPSALLYVPSGGFPAQRQQLAPLLHEAVEQARQAAALPKKKRRNHG